VQDDPSLKRVLGPGGTLSWTTENQGVYHGYSPSGEDLGIVGERPIDPTISPVDFAAGGVPGMLRGGLALRMPVARPLNFSEAGGLTNQIPTRMARVVPGEVNPTMLGRPGSADVFVTAADDIAGMNPAQVAERLTIPQSRSFTVIEFPRPAEGVASPVLRSNPGFVGGGRTAGGAREFVIPNGPVPEGAVIRRVEP